jgi:hypothetical protein
MDHPPPDHLRFRDRVVHGGGRRFFPACSRCLGRIAACPAVARGCRGGRAGLDGHAHPRCFGLGMAELEVPATGQGRRHDLRPLDADPEAPAREERAHGDRRLAGGRPHRGWGGLRRRRGRGERGAFQPPWAGAGRGRGGSCRRGSHWPASKTPARQGVRWRRAACGRSRGRSSGSAAASAAAGTSVELSAPAAPAHRWAVERRRRLRGRAGACR